MQENLNYSADQPIFDIDQDRFQRYEFCKRIAQTIILRQSNECIVFGLYGAWGEGKSTVLNFINRELKKDLGTEVVLFNPWRYGDETSLLTSFFEKIAKTLNVELYTKIERFGKVAGKVAKAANVTGYDAGGLASLLSDTDIEEFKIRVDGFLRQSGKKIVIIIDDIDRLDKQEIHALFRLVKLTADFYNTTYILSFDEKMVAAAVAERYGDGETKSGLNFLEKIIQVPLNLPKARPEALRKYCFELMEKVIDFEHLGTTEQDMKRFVSQFTLNVQLSLTTPRQAARYSNALSFAVPLLKGEVNMVDLMLLEALKIFYPEHYQLKKTQPEHFFSSVHDLAGSRKDTLASELEKCNSNLTVAQSKAVSGLLGNLFPFIGNNRESVSMRQNRENLFYSDQRIASADYFDRYFSYTVIEGDLSDLKFDAFWNGLSIVDFQTSLERVCASLIFVPIKNRIYLHNLYSIGVLFLSALCGRL